MFSMFKQMFTALTVLFAATEKMAKAIDNLATVGEEMSANYLEESRIENQVRIAQLRKDNKKLLAVPVE